MKSVLKQMKLFLVFLVIISLCFYAEICIGEENPIIEHKDAYKQSLSLLNAYLQSFNSIENNIRIEAVYELFVEQGKIGKYSIEFRSYTEALYLLEKGDYAEALDHSFDLLNSQAYASFRSYLNGSDEWEKEELYAIGTVEDLFNYVQARAFEAEGNIQQARECYDLCKTFYDAAERFYALAPDTTRVSNVSNSFVGKWREIEYVHEGNSICLQDISECKSLELHEDGSYVIIDARGYEWNSYSGIESWMTTETGAVFTIEGWKIDLLDVGDDLISFNLTILEDGRMTGTAQEIDYQMLFLGEGNIVTDPDLTDYIGVWYEIYNTSWGNNPGGYTLRLNDDGSASYRSDNHAITEDNLKWWWDEWNQRVVYGKSNDWLDKNIIELFEGGFLCDGSYAGGYYSILSKDRSAIWQE